MNVGNTTVARNTLLYVEKLTFSNRHETVNSTELSSDS